MSNVVAAAKRRDWSTAYWLLIVALLGLPLVAPLLRWSAVPCTHDGHLHYHRIAALRHMWENGIFFSRWMPDLAFGYGYPFFVYREGPPLYLPLIPHVLGMPLPAASNLFYALTILAAGMAMFLWVRDLFGERAGVVSAVAYMAAPYVLVDALVRGNSPESLALPLLPFILWAGRRWVLFGTIGPFLAGVFGLALLSLSHNISAVIFAPTAAVYLLALALFADAGRQADASGQAGSRPRRWSGFRGRLLRLAALLGLGLGLAFFYTGGALLELDQVTLEQSTTTRNNDWRYNFASLTEILAPVAPEDPDLVNPPLKFRLGWAPLLLAALGATGLLWIKGADARGREQRLHIWLMLLGAAAYLFMALPISSAVWEALPLIDFVQFPWRFVGRAALPVAFLAGVPFYWFDRPRAAQGGDPTALGRMWPAVAPAIAVSLLILETLPNLYPRYCREDPFPTIQTVHTYERVTGLVGVDPEGSYFPRTVKERPAGSPLEADYLLEGRSIRRFDEAAMPPGAAISAIDYGRRGVTLSLNTPEPFTARYLSFAFPGWTATVDGEPTAITPEDPTGLITFPVPAGTHAIEVRWGATPTRLALVALSVLSAIGVVIVAATVRRQPGESARHAALPGGRPRDRRWSWAALLAAAVLLAGAKALMDVRVDGRLPDTPPVEHPLALRGGELALEGYTLSRERVPSGETLDVDMAWRAVAPPAVDYQTEIWLADSEGRIWSEKGTQRPRLYEDAAPTRLWAPGEWGWDSREVSVLPGTPEGDYDIVLTLFDRATLQPVTLLDNSGNPIGPATVLDTVRVEKSSEPGPPPAQVQLEAGIPGTALTLLGYNQDRDAAAPGDPLLLTLFWRCAEPAACQRVRLSLVDEAGVEARHWDIPAVREGLGQSAWPETGYLRGQHLLQLPAGLESGTARFVLDGAVELGEVAITAPERVFEQPPLALTLGAPFFAPGGQTDVVLSGVAAGSGAQPACTGRPAPGGSCALPLVWGAQSELATGYHVFVHLVDEAGNILAQSDGVPAGWTRPTTGWLPGEFITDEHILTLPSILPDGALTLRIGLYDPLRGTRLQTGGQEYATLPVEP